MVFRLLTVKVNAEAHACGIQSACTVVCSMNLIFFFGFADLGTDTVGVYQKDIRGGQCGCEKG
jgi:hypothetical protein